MSANAHYLSPAEAAGELGVSSKALRLYEERGLMSPVRTAAGWRAYGPDDMATARDIVTLRKLGLSLGQIGKVLNGDHKDLAPILATHQTALEGQMATLKTTLADVAKLQASLSEGGHLAANDLVRLFSSEQERTLNFPLPWPWDGEKFELRLQRSLTFVVGPLGSGKTRLIQKIAERVPGAAFIGLDRLEESATAEAKERLQNDAALNARVDQALDWLRDDGATVSDALQALVLAIETDGPEALVIDMLEQNLDTPTQEAVIAYLRRTLTPARPLFATTRSSMILDFGAITATEAIILCPANHSPPSYVHPYPGAPGYEAIKTCLATPDVRARTAGVVAVAMRVGGG